MNSEIEKKAREIVAGYYEEASFITAAKKVREGGYGILEVPAAYDGILAGLEMAAKVAESRIRMYGESNSERDGTALSIAHAIRALATTETPG